MKYLAILLAVVAALCAVQAAPAPQLIAGSPLAGYAGYSAYSPYSVYNSGYYNPYNTLGYSGVGYSLGGVAPYAYY